MQDRLSVSSHNDSARRSPARAVAGFSLVEFLVVITLIGLLMTYGFSTMQAARETAHESKCQDNLSQMGAAMLLFKDMRNKSRWPRESGMRFLLTLNKVGEVTGRSSDIFICPGTQDFNDGGPSGEPGSSYEDWEALNSADISYAGRDVSAYPLRGGNDADFVLAADDNEFGNNHTKVINVLYGNGAVQPWNMFMDGAEILSAYPEMKDGGIPVGPESPVELFQVLRID
ncbi:MAG: prepilin-type N-terminal cleavage/methylation domain-containing protein [Pseudohongiellaceae bacterium]